MENYNNSITYTNEDIEEYLRVNRIENKTKMSYDDFLKLDVLEQMRLYEVLDLYTDKEKEKQELDKNRKQFEKYYKNQKIKDFISEYKDIAVFDTLGSAFSIGTIGYSAYMLCNIPMDEPNLAGPIWFAYLALGCLLQDEIYLDCKRRFSNYLEEYNDVEKYYDKKEKVKQFLKTKK